MRITGGDYRGRTLHTPKAGVRPTQEMVRQALFNILMTRIAGARVLDLYAGSGAVGLEALSRGATDVIWVERDRRTLSILRRNVKTLSEGKGRVVADDALCFLKRGVGHAPYDIVFADPPYTDARASETDPLFALLEATQRQEMLARDGIFVYESAGGRRATRNETIPTGWQNIIDREYGRTRLRGYVLKPQP